MTKGENDVVTDETDACPLSSASLVHLLMLMLLREEDVVFEEMCVDVFHTSDL